MSNPDDKDWLDEVLGEFWRSTRYTANVFEAGDFAKTRAAIEAHYAKELEKAVYGFHEYLIGKNILQYETDQAFNYARLHRALDDYIAQLNKEGTDESAR